ncbi:MAG: hypothetical protein HZB13_03655 [Acidobacteria bacterium]|nr:hypothetical protein [Acidobacteriota bacterium]
MNHLRLLRSIARLTLVPLSLIGPASAQHPPALAPRVSPQVFPIMAWGGSPSDPESLQLMKQAGLNVSGFCRVEDLDRVRDAGLTCFVSDPQLHKFVAANQATDSEIRDAVAALVSRIVNHPAALGVNLRDEPSVQQMPILGRISAELLKAMPGKLPYVNLFPNYASPQQLGADSYEAHLRQYVKIVKLPYLSWDNYSLSDGEMQPSFYDNLDQVRRVTLEAGIPFWNCILSQALFRYMEPSDATFHLQAYATMAYGGRGIQFFTYFTPEIGNFRLAPIDQFGNRTATWDILRRITNQIHALAPVLVKLRSTGVYHWPVSTAAGTPLLEGVGPGAKLLIGEFADPSGRPYVMLVNKSLRDSTSLRLQPRLAGAKIFRISPVTGREGPFGGEGNWLAPGAGVLLRIEPPPPARP